MFAPFAELHNVAVLSNGEHVYSYQVVESMRRGMEPKQAAADAVSRIARKYPDFVGAVFAINTKGEHAGACHNWTFQYSVRNANMDDVEVFTVEP